MASASAMKPFDPYYCTQMENDLCEKTGDYLTCRLCNHLLRNRKDEIETPASKHIRCTHPEVYVQYDPEQPMPDLSTIFEYYNGVSKRPICIGCHKIFSDPVLKHLENHLLYFHGLSSEEINDVPNGKMLLLSQVPRLSVKMHEFSNETAEELLVREYFTAKSDTESVCNICSRTFVRKNATILACHVSLAHPVVEKTYLQTTPEILKEVTKIYFEPVKNKLKCKLCSQFFTLNFCLPHMEMSHETILRTIYQDVNKRNALEKAPMRRDENRRHEMLKKLNYNPRAGSTVTHIEYDDVDPDNLRCDFFENVGSKMQCLVCGLMIKTTKICYLLKHLRVQHCIYQANKPNAEMVATPAEPPVKKIKCREQNIAFEHGYANPSPFELDELFIYNFFVLVHKETICMCCGLKFGNNSYATLFKHIRMMHPSIFSDYADRDDCSNEKRALPPYTRRRPAKAERNLAQLMLSNGFSFESLEDPTLHQIQYALIRNSSLTDASFFNTVMEDLSNESQKVFNGRSYGDLCATVDWVEDDDGDCFAAISMHHIDENGKRVNNVYLKKIVEPTMTKERIQSLLTNIIKDYNYGNVTVKRIVVKESQKEYCSNMDAEIFQCFYSGLSDCMDRIFKSEQIKNMIDRTFAIFYKIRNSSELYSKFELVKNATGSKLDINNVRRNCWRSVLGCFELLYDNTRTLFMFKSFVHRWEIGKWLTDAEIEAIRGVVKFFRSVDEIGWTLSNRNSTISRVLPTFRELHNFVDNCFPNCDDIKKEVTNKICSFYARFVGEYKQTYEFAMFLDPRYAYDETVEKDWNAISSAYLLCRGDAQSSDSLRDEKWPDVTYDEKLQEEIYTYFKMCPVPLDMDMIAWWDSKRSEIPYLYERAADYFNIPACTLNAKFFFGPKGKFSHMAKGMTFEQLDHALRAISKSEQFRGEGCELLPENHDGKAKTEKDDDDYSQNDGIDQAPPLPEKIAVLARTRLDDDAEAHRAAKKDERLISRQTLRHNKLFMPSLDMLIPPPPVLDRMDEDTKNEINDESEDQKPVLNPYFQTVQTESTSKPVEASKSSPTLREVKEEPISDDEPIANISPMNMNAVKAEVDDMSDDNLAMPVLFSEVKLSEPVEPPRLSLASPVIPPKKVIRVLKTVVPKAVVPTNFSQTVVRKRPLDVAPHRSGIKPGLYQPGTSVVMRNINNPKASPGLINKQTIKVLPQRMIRVLPRPSPFHQVKEQLPIKDATPPLKEVKTEVCEDSNKQPSTSKPGPELLAEVKTEEVEQPTTFVNAQKTVRVLPKPMSFLKEGARMSTKLSQNSTPDDVKREVDDGGYDKSAATSSGVAQPRKMIRVVRVNDKNRVAQDSSKKEGPRNGFSLSNVNIVPQKLIKVSHNSGVSQTKYK